MTPQLKQDRQFGGPYGTFFFLIFSHCLLYYFWYCIAQNNAHMFGPSEFTLNGIVTMIKTIFTAVLSHAIPNISIFCMYSGFIGFQLFLAGVMPGYIVKGLPLVNNKDKSLLYLCNAYSSYYLTLTLLFLVNFFNWFRLSFIYDNLGQFLTSAIIFSNLFTILIHILTILFNRVHFDVTGNLIYDFFMGNCLNPRIKNVDIKMVAEVRLSWLLLFIITISAACKQLETTSHISIQMWFIILAQFLYSNACAKGEHFIPMTWDMTYEKFGWMLNFWNLAGVPFLYALQSSYIIQNPKDLSIIYIIFCFLFLLIAYYFWDTANLQHCDWRMRERGIIINRNTFPNFYWAKLTNPKVLQTPQGTLVADGYYKYCRKLNYTADASMALVWGLICGFDSYLPYFYFIFFILMIIHRWTRDEERCSKKYGEFWQKYKEMCPYVFIPKII